MILIIGTSGTVAYLSTNTLSVKNQFKAGVVSPTIIEEFDGEIKQNVVVQNHGDVDVFIRAAIIISWVDEDGNIYGIAPQKEHYTMDLNLRSDENPESNWIRGADGYYYWLKDVEPSGITDNLINKCSLNDDVIGPVGYNFCVEVIAQTIQSNPDNAVEESWENDKVTIDADNGVLMVTDK